MPQYAWVIPVGIRSRIALQSQSSLECPTLSYMVCGVGICPKLSTDISCGEIIINLQNFTQPIPFAVVFAFVFASLV